MTQQVIAGLRFVPVAPWWLVALLAVVCIAALAVAAWRRAPGTAWRGLAFLVLILWLAGPRVIQETRTALPDIGLLVIDQTASMTVGDRAALVARARRALEADAAHTQGLELRTVTVPEAGQDGTHLFAAIDRALAGIPHDQLAGIVAVTDGQVHDAPKTWRYGVPLHVLLTGAGEETDRRLRLIQAPGYGVVGKSVTLRVAIDDLGVAHPAAAAMLTIRRDGDPPVRESVPVGVAHDIKIPISREGPSVVELSVDKLPGEISTLNNRVALEINGVRDRLRVLLISGEPHVGERTWRRLLKSDPSVDLVHFTILRPPEKDDLTPLNELALIAFPTHELFVDKIGEFDLIILDRFQNRGILPPPYLQNIADYVRRGGALLMSVGPEFGGPATLDDTALQQILPAHPLRGPDGEPDAADVVNGAFRPSVTPLGTRHPVTADLPGWHASGPPDWGPWYRYDAVEDARGEVLLSADAGPGQPPAPLLVLDRVGKGRVAELLSDQIWLWSRGHMGGGPQAELLRRLAHWLMRQPALEENALTARMAPGGTAGPQLTIGRTSTEDAPPPMVTVTAPDGTRRSVTLHATGPGRGAASLPAAAPGVWQVSDGTRVAYAAGNLANPREIADLRATASVLRPLAGQSGGSLHWLAAAHAPYRAAGAPELRRTEPGRATAGAGWIGLPERGAHVVTALATIPLLPGWLALLLLLGLVIFAWWREAA